MYYDYPDVRRRKAHGIGLLRETLLCRNCGATMRDRTLAFGLLKTMADRFGRTECDLRAFRKQPPGSLKILDTDSFSPISKVLRGLEGYTHSQFIPGLANGSALTDGSINVNLESMPFPDGTFDVILTSDVMEHVADDIRAHAEIFRCLIPGGVYLFTVPYDPSILSHRMLTLKAGKLGSRFFLERHIHGDPHSDSGILAHRIYGQQLLSDMKALGYSVQFQLIEESASGIFGGDLFVAKKDALKSIRP